MKKIISDEASMLLFGRKLAVICENIIEKLRQDDNGIIIGFYGSLGAGKTTLARGFLQGLGHEGQVKSPTYTLVESYQLPIGVVNHFDFYRLRDPHELEVIGIQDYFLPKTICLIEWPEIGLGFLPPSDLSCYIKADGAGREVELIAHTDLGQTILKRIHHD